MHTPRHSRYELPDQLPDHQADLARYYARLLPYAVIIILLTALLVTAGAYRLQVRENNALRAENASLREEALECWDNLEATEVQLVQWEQWYEAQKAQQQYMKIRDFH